MSVVEMKMLRWMSGVTRENRIRTEFVRGSIGIALIVDKVREYTEMVFRVCDEERGNEST